MRSCTAPSLLPGGQMPWQADASLDQLVDGAVPNAESSTGGFDPSATIG